MEPTDDIPIPLHLYTVEQLLGAWTVDKPLSYAASLDARTFSAAVRVGLRTPISGGIARQRALHDHGITRALDAAIVDRPVVAFMGGHALERGSASYVLVAQIASRLASLNLLVVTGGGPGAMEAAHLGARLAKSPPGDLADAVAILSRQAAFPKYKLNEFVHPDGTFDHDILARLHAWQVPAFEVADAWPEGPVISSIGVPTWLYGHEPPTPLASAHAKYFENSLREDGLLAIAKAGVIFAEGKAGTLQEVFQDAAQNYYSTVDDSRSPMVFLDVDEFWSVRRPVRLLLEGLFDDEAEKLLHFVTTVDGAVTAITGEEPRRI